MMNMFFAEYREILDRIAVDPEIVLARQRVTNSRSNLAWVEAELADLEAGYRQDLDAAAAGITSYVIDAKKTITGHGIRATFRRERKSVSWKKIADSLNPSIHLIRQHTRIGKPSVTISRAPATDESACTDRGQRGEGQ